MGFTENFEQMKRNVAAAEAKKKAQSAPAATPAPAPAPTQESTAAPPSEDPIRGVIQDRITNPELPPGAEFTPVDQQVQPGELTTPPEVDPARLRFEAGQTQPAAQAGIPDAQEAATFEAAQTDPSQNVMQAAQGAVSSQAQVQAQQGTLSPETLAALDPSLVQGKVDPRSLAQNQYAQLMDFGPDEVPGWAKGALRTANQIMADRGLAASTMAGEAVTAALMQAALPIAFQDAKVFENMTLANLDKKAQAAFLKAGYLAQMDFQNLNNRQQAAVINAQSFLQMDLANLNNEQQARILNSQNKQQAMLSNTAARNAARQFNAASQNQMTQFYEGLAAQIETFNANQFNEMQRFNVDQGNAVKSFNANLENDRDKFNKQNQLIVEQANANYLRQINTANTAQQNQANLQNSQNLLEISNTGMANAIQLYRDDEAYIFQESENEKDRQENRALMLLNRDIALQLMDERQKNELCSALGSFAANTLNNLLEDA